MANHSGHYDPLDLDKTAYAQFLREIAGHMFDDHPPEPPHPLEVDKRIGPVLDYIKQMRRKIDQSYNIQSEASPENPYLMSQNGMTLRPEVIIALTFLYISEHPEIIAKQE